jgi:hypothetical protein
VAGGFAAEPEKEIAAERLTCALIAVWLYCNRDARGVLRTFERWIDAVSAGPHHTENRHEHHQQ